MTKINSSQSIAKRLSAYSAVAAGTVAATGNANAAEVVWDIPDLTSTSNAEIVLFDMVSGKAVIKGAEVLDGEGEFQLYQGGSDAGFIGQAPSITTGGFAGLVDGSGYTVVSQLAGGASVSEDLTFGAYSSAPSNWAYLADGYGGGFANGQTGVVGLKFELNGETHYGWAEVTRAVAGDSFTLNSFGYNDTPDAASVVPGGGEVKITTLDVSDGTATITFKGKPNTIYTCKTSATLIGFSTTIPTSGSTTTDENGDATFQVAAVGVKRFYLIAE